MKRFTFLKQNWIFFQNRFILLLILTGVALMANSQRIYPDMAVTISAGGSDYQLTFTYSGAGVVNCTDNVKHDFQIYKNNDHTHVHKISGSGSQSNGTINYVAGPNNSGYWGLRYSEWEDCSLAWCDCVAWVWSGYPRANSSDDRGTGYSVLTYATTVPIKSPTGLTASSETFYDKITIEWNKGTNIPDANVQYRIYRGTTLNNGVLIHTAAGGARTWTDNNVEPNEEYYYWVTTYTSSWGVHESPRNNGNAVLGKAKKLIIKASDGLYTNRVKLEWEDLSSFAEEIRVERSIPKSTEREELAILSKNAKAYNDDEAIPGYNYTYYITPISPPRSFRSLSDMGYKKPDGTIKGNITSVLGAGVEGVTVCAIPITADLPTGAVPAPAGGYCTTTDIDGYYEIRNIYYFDEAEFRVIPSKSGPIGPHIFRPDSITRTLNLNSKLSSGANFTDESVFTVSGKVTFPGSTTGVECGVPNVEILFNGQSRAIFTKSDGTWNYAIQEEGTFTFKPEFLHHTFENEENAPSTTVLVNDDVSGINFVNTQVDSIRVKVQGGCGNPLGDYASVKVTSPGNCYNQTFQTDENGLLTLKNLPARKYSLQVIEISPNNSNIRKQIGEKPITLDLTVRDTAKVISERDSIAITPADTLRLSNGSIFITPADTTITTLSDTTRSEVFPKADFIYFSPLQIAVDFADAGAEVINCTTHPYPIVLMEQNITYKLTFDITEQLGGCPIKEGNLRLFDFISDKGNAPIVIPIVNGIATYIVEAGLPEIAVSQNNNHEKLLYVIPEVGFLDAQPVEYWVAVTGVVTQAPSFITRSVELPMLVLHDPPGDNSYAFVEKGTQFRSFESHEVLVGGEAGVFANLLIGAKVITPFSTNSFGTMINFKAVAGRDNFNRNGVETVITFNETFSTSNMENLTGNDGDVYIGAAFNQEFAIGDELTFNKTTCQFVTRVVPTIDVTGFATTFIYTEKHIKNTLLPKLGELREAIINKRDVSLLSEEEKIQANQLYFDSLHWVNVIALNAANRDEKAIFKENKSFSAGAPYSNSYSTNTTNSVSYEYNTFVNLDLDIGIKIDNAFGAWFDSEVGFTSKFRWGTRTNSGNDTTISRTVGYILDDNDIGDFFSVDILEDTAYGVPAFRLKLGTSSCPHEPGTQPRDDAKINIFPPKIDNVPLGGQAVFTANLTNQSQSRETREYGVRVISTTNPDGAIIKIGGQQINNMGANFFLNFNQTASISLTVERGPLAASYDSIGIMMYPPCEYDLWGDGGDITSADTAWIFVNFQSSCSNVALHLPGDGWLVNQNNNNILNVAFTGYDKNNKNLESITLQYRREGQGWIDEATISKELLVENFFDYPFNVSGLPDGHYRLRAKAWCGIEGGISYSSEQKGIIDRTSLEPFGTPSPSDGFLRFGQEISVVFDKDINCNFNSYDPTKPAPEIKLYLEDGTEIPSSVQCSENLDKIIIVPDEDLFAQLWLEGVKVYAVVDKIQDNSGNVQKYKTQWSFLVNVSPVAWNPEKIHLTAVETDEVIFIANLGNTALLNKPFIITEWPDWLTPSVTSATVLPGSSFTIQLKADDGLNPGYYEGQVVALVDGVPEVLNVSLELYSEGINWFVNHSEYEHNMNIVAQFSADDGDINLSKGLRDKIAAYVNGELRGVGNIQYVQALNKYAAFINVVSNLSGGNGSFLDAKDYVADLSVQDITVSDEGITAKAARFKKNNWIEFHIVASKSGIFNIEFRLASSKAGEEADIFIDGVLKKTIVIPATGGTASYLTLTTTVEISEGEHVFRLQSKNAEFDLNWINFPEYHVRNKYSTEVIDFRMWDGLNGIEYGAVEKLTFFRDGVVGSVEKPFILHPAGGIQEMVLPKGWTWISINKMSTNMSVDNVFQSITAPTSKNEITLKSQTSFSQYNKNTGWQGPLTSVDMVSGYLINLSSHSDTLSLIGKAPENDVVISLNPKWNWIGFPKQGVMNANDVLSQLTSNSGDIVKSQFEFAEYNDGVGSWIGDLKFFQPGRGYKLFVSNSENLTYLKSASIENLSLKHEYTMTLTATVEFGVLPDSDNYELRTYINGQVRGEAPLKFINGLGKIMAFSMIYGDRADIGEDVSIVLWDNFNQKEIELSSDRLLFGIDKIAGTISNPVVLSAMRVDVPNSPENILRFETYPNPFSSKAKISYYLPSDTHVVLRITDSFGKEITRITDENQRAGNYEYVFEAKDLPSGIYFSTLIAGETIQTKKLILLKD
jgi:hypothetical protein